MSRSTGNHVTREDSQLLFLAQHGVATLLRMCCAKNRRCETSRVIEDVSIDNEYEF